MKKNISILWATAILISFCFANSSLAEDVVSKETSGTEIKKEKEELDIAEVKLEKTLSELKTEAKAISQEHAALKAGFTEYAQRKMGYDQKCAGQTFHRDNPGEMQIEGECRVEKSWLESTHKTLTERKGKNDKREEDYKTNFAQFKLDADAWQVKMDAWLKERDAAITKIAHDKILAFKDQKIRDWVLKNVKIEICTDSGLQHQLSPWAGDFKLVFTEYFLMEETAVMQENLIAFEAGKVFLISLKDKPVKDGETLEAWFNRYSPRYNSVIENMKENMLESMRDTTHLNIADSTAQLDSAFGYIFRTQVLQLDNKKEWDEAIREFRKCIDPLLQSR